MLCRFCGKTGIRLVKSAKNNYGVQYYTCTPCNTARVKEYVKTPKGRASRRKSVIRYRKNNPLRVSAWIKVREAGLKKRPCATCGEFKVVHAHHPDILKPLDVVFLCPLCHKMEDLGLDKK